MDRYECFKEDFGDTSIKVDLQVDEYKGSLIYEIGGNCKGLSALPRDGSSILENVERAKFKGMSISFVNDTDYAGEVTLTSANGDTCVSEFEDEFEFEQMIVGMSIIGFKSEE